MEKEIKRLLRCFKRTELSEQDITDAIIKYADQEKEKEALSFAEWMFSVTKEYQRGGTYTVTLPLDNSKTYTITELYQIFKKNNYEKMQK